MLKQAISQTSKTLKTKANYFRNGLNPKNVETYTEITHSAFNEVCSSVDIHAARLGAVFLGRGRLYAVVAWSTARVAIWVLPPCSSYLVIWSILRNWTKEQSLSFRSDSFSEGAQYTGRQTVSHTSSLSCKKIFLVFLFPLKKKTSFFWKGMWPQWE